MGRAEIDFENRDRLIDLGIAISMIRKRKGISQEELADRVNISRSHLSTIEAPGLVRGCSLNVLYNISDALEVSPADLLYASESPENNIEKIFARQAKEAEETGDGSLSPVS